MMNLWGFFDLFGQFSTCADLQTFFSLTQLKENHFDCFLDVFFYFCQVKTFDSWHQQSSPMCFQLLQEKTLETPNNIKSHLAMMDIICSSEVAVEPRLTGLGHSLQESLMGMQCFPILAKQKSDRGQQQTSEGFGSCIWVWRVNRGHTDPLTSCQWFTVDVHTSHTLTFFSLDLLPSFPRSWRVLSISVSSAIYQTVCL